ncbi:MAG: hypothetical protein ACREGG_00355 [Candidatus Saccharimonadales bacterium]
MNKHNNSQKGFAVVESLLILVIIAVIVGIGWYAWHTKHQTDKILSQADKISQSAPTASTNLVTGKLANDKVTFTYDENIWQAAPNAGEVSLCGQSVLSSAKCLDLATLVLKKEGVVNPDQFQVSIGVFKKDDNKNVKDWLSDDVDAVEGEAPTFDYISSTPRQVLRMTADYSNAGPMEKASDEIRLDYGIVSTHYGVLAKTVLFNKVHYSFSSQTDYHPYMPNVEDIVKSIRITDN